MKQKEEGAGWRGGRGLIDMKGTGKGRPRRNPNEMKTAFVAGPLSGEFRPASTNPPPVKTNS